MGSKLTYLILQYCFNVLNMNRVKAGCLAVNIAAHKVNIKAGMTHEATLRQRSIKMVFTTMFTISEFFALNLLTFRNKFLLQFNGLFCYPIV